MAISCYITGVNGLTQLTTIKEFTVTAATAATFSLSGVNGKTYSSYTSAGPHTVRKAGCEYFKFKNSSAQDKLYQIQHLR